MDTNSSPSGMVSVHGMERGPAGGGVPGSAGDVGRVRPSRVDLCADFHIPAGLSLDFLRTRLASRSSSHRHHETAGRLETFYIGSAQSPVQARI